MNELFSREQLDEYQQSYMSGDPTFLTAYRLTGESKLPGIADFLESLIENNCKFIVFAHHKIVIDGIE